MTRRKGFVKNNSLRTSVATAIALIAFAANSVLCRLALGEDKIDAASFAFIRLFSGSIILLLIVKMTFKKETAIKKGNWYSGIMLFLYASAFSFAYITLDTGTGALILFGSVQMTMILIYLKKGNRLKIKEWIGIILALIGFVYLVIPGVTAPPIIGFVLMTLAGIGWGIYTLNGRKSKIPLVDTTYNFIRTMPLVLLLLLISLPFVHYTFKGIVLAIFSGGIASGIGYVIWYYALGGLTSLQASIVQLLVPVLAAFGGIVFISEELSIRLLVASFLILGGILLVVLGKYNFVGKVIK